MSNIGIRVRAVIETIAETDEFENNAVIRNLIGPNFMRDLQHDLWFDFGKDFPLDELNQLHTVQDLIDYVQHRI